MMLTGYSGLLAEAGESVPAQTMAVGAGGLDIIDILPECEWTVFFFMSVLPMGAQSLGLFEQMFVTAK